MIYKFIFSTVLSWIFFPIGLFKSGLSLWGFNSLIFFYSNLNQYTHYE